MGLSKSHIFKKMVEQIPTCILGKTPYWRGVMLEGGCDPMGSACWSRLLAGSHRERSPCWSRFVARAVTPQRTHAGAVLSQGMQPWKGPMVEQFMKNCSLWEGLILEKSMDDCLLWEGPHAGAKEECESSPEEERTSETIFSVPLGKSRTRIQE